MCPEMTQEMYPQLLELEGNSSLPSPERHEPELRYAGRCSKIVLLHERAWTTVGMSWSPSCREL
jgi:hypothetical protein